jgi:hypothetical protein
MEKTETTPLMKDLMDQITKAQGWISPRQMAINLGSLWANGDPKTNSFYPYLRKLVASGFAQKRRSLISGKETEYRRAA